MKSYKNRIIQQLCQYHDEEFLEQVFLTIVKRPIDETGKQHYLPILRASNQSKESIIASIRFSAEGKQQAVQVKGIRKYHFINKLQSLGHKASFLRLFVIMGKLLEGLIKMPTLVNQLLNHEQQIENAAIEFEKLKESFSNKQQQALTQLQQLTTEQASLQTENKQLKQEIIRNNTYIQQLQNTLSDLLSEISSAKIPKELEKQQSLNEKALNQPELNQEALQKLEQVLKTEQDKFFDLLYVAFEDHFRGTQEEIKQQMSVYLPYLDAVYEKDKPILDIGCGRGEWLQLITEHNMQAKGIDLNTVMVDEAKSKQLNAENQEALNYLKQQADESLSAVTGIHLIEHIPFESLVRILQEVKRVLKKGGVAIFETPNPENVFVGSLFFYTDPTHNNPLVPETMKFIFQYLGYTKVEIKRLHSYAEVSEAAGKIRDLSDNFRNHHFYSELDYSIIAYNE